jgi:environmental stress-induced protein Ves
MNLVHLRRDQYRSMPWRNGAGSTLEIAREPVDGSDFLWRLSLATIASDGPFSSYAGYRRSVTLVAGEGFRLAIDDRQPVALQTVGASALFDGAAAVQCALIDGPCSDLSLMVRAPGTIASVRRLQGEEVRVLPLPAAARSAVFCLRGSTRLVHGAGLQLAQHDTVLFDSDPAPRSLPASPDGLAELLLLSWTSSGVR